MSIAVTALVLSLFGGQETTGATSAQPPPKTDCSAPEYRQFDFWLGSWDVTAKGKPAGTNRIESAMGGCALVEHWRSAGGSDGMSLNAYDRATQTWSQTWVDQGGNVLRLTGTFKDGRMILQSEPRTKPGRVSIERITWSKQPDGSVRQLWESSADNGTTWTVAFDGRYVAKS